jgi:hypothetical protein
MLIQYLDSLNRYSNLILVAVTAVYVILTWRMVKEMRQAREAESAPHLIATLIPFSSLNVKLRIHNAGRGPAIDIKAVFWLEPSNGTETTTWRHPAMLSDASENFIPPGRQFALEKLAAQHDRMVVNLQWFNAFGRKYEAKYEIDLKRQQEGWYDVGFLVQLDDTPTQLGKIKDELSKIRSYLDKIEGERTSRAFMKQYRRENSPWRKLWMQIAKKAQQLLHSQQSSRR